MPKDNQTTRFFVPLSSDSVPTRSDAPICYWINRYGQKVACPPVETTANFGRTNVIKEPTGSRAIQKTSSFQPGDFYLSLTSF